MNTSPIVENTMRLVKVDFAPTERPPSAGRWAIATSIALIGSVVADTLLAIAGVAVFPSTKGYEHFQFGDYVTLTTPGVIAASLGWPIIVAISSAPHWVYSRMAVLVSAVLLLPDVWLLLQHNPTNAVAVLVAMHLAIAVITYFSLTRIAVTRAMARLRG